MSPTLEEWRQLYSNAKALYDVAPWNGMWDSDVFGVQPSDGEETGYCCVMGRLGEHFALAVYLGSDGLAGLWKMQQGEFHHDANAILFAQKCLMVSFEDREMIDKTDKSRTLRVRRTLGGTPFQTGVFNPRAGECTEFKRFLHEEFLHFWGRRIVAAA